MDLATQLLLATLAAFGGLGLFVLSSIARDIREMSHSVANLNEKMAVIVERVDSHENRLKDLEKDL